ncbi:UNVERIFIED_CONTAM: hypothetical protein FKN15_077529 [Acipenser sinensis]
MKSSVSRMYSWENERYPLEERRYRDRGKSGWEYENYERIDTCYRDYRTYKDCNPPGQNYRDYDRPEEQYRTYDRPEEQYRTYEGPEQQYRTYDRPEKHYREYERPEKQYRTYDRAEKQYRTYDRPEEQYRTYDRAEKHYREYARPEKQYRTYEGPEQQYRGYERPEQQYRGYERPEKYCREYDRPEKRYVEQKAYRLSDDHDRPERYCKSSGVIEQECGDYERSGKHYKEWSGGLECKQQSVQADQLSRENGVEDGRYNSIDLAEKSCQDPKLLHCKYEDRDGEKITDTGSWGRNNRYRRTAPSTLRRSEFALNRNKPREMTLLTADPISLESTNVTAPSADPEQRMMEKRSKVIEELLQTEKDYIKDMQMCVQEIIHPLQRKQVQNIDFDGLFGNVQMVIDLSTRLLTGLQDTESIGSIFVEHKTELEEISPMGKTNYINLGSFVIKPVQRVMRYPLLLMELLNTTPESHPDKRLLAQAVDCVKEINVNINEYKRRKDLVVKYRKGEEATLIDKISKLSVHSIMKKTNRVSSHLKHLTGFSPQIKDEVFDEVDKRFRVQERLIKSFLRDLSLYLQHIRESASVNVLSAISFSDIYSDRTQTDLESFQKAHRCIGDQRFTGFKERTESLVIAPLNQLLTMFAGPHKLIQKRFDKLLDYNNCKERAEKMKDKKTVEELQSARNNYEALTAQLLDELPKFHSGAQELFTSCVHSFAGAHKEFVRVTLGELKPLLQLSGVISTDGNIISLFQEQHSRVLQQLQCFSFFPESLPTVRKTFERKSLEPQSSRKQLAGPPNYVLQTEEHRAALLSRYPPEQLCQAERNFNAAQDLDVSVLEGDIVGVIKQQDPMGSQNRWLIDNGVTKGFVYSSFLKPYNPRRSQSDVSIGSHSSNESGYGGSSPVYSRQNSNSTLTFNSNTTSVTLSTLQSQKYCQDSGTSSQSNPPEGCSSKHSSSRETTLPLWTQSNHKDLSDSASETDSCSSLKSVRTDFAPRSSQVEMFSQSDVAFGSVMRRNGDSALRTVYFPSYTTPENESDPEGNQIYYAIYSFNARCANELTICAHQRVKIIEFHDMNGNKEWWLGEVEGRRGYVPSNYIRKTEYT